jgi:hypothetical protein
MRLGLIGPSNGDAAALREAVEFLVGDAAVDQAIYLGNDDAIDQVLAAWSEELLGVGGEDAFLDRVARVARTASSAELEKLLAADVAVERLGVVRCLPAPPARAMEMIDDRVVLLVHDKAMLDEEDIANAHLIVYGKSPKDDLKRFGQRYFFTPGPLSGGKVGLVDVESDGRIAVALYDPAGAPLFREALVARTGKLMVMP